MCVWGLTFLSHAINLGRMLEILLNVILLAAGISLLYFGGDWLVKGAVTLADRLGVSALVIGLTVVAFGTSAPELAVNIRAALSSNIEDVGISFGNIFGSNIANIALILAICAILKTLTVNKQLVRKTIPLLLAFTGLATFMVLDPIRKPGEKPEIDWFDGMVLLILFACFLYLTTMSALGKRKRTLLPGAVEGVGDMAGDYSVKVAVLVVLGSLGGLWLGAELTVSSAIFLAEKASISKAVIGLTVVAFGTSLPELAVGVIATLRGQADLAIGNVVGSNVFNLLLVMGVTSSIRDVPFPLNPEGGYSEGGWVDVIVFCWVVVLLYLTVLTQKRISKVEGWILLTIYLLYTSWRFFFSPMEV